MSTAVSDFATDQELTILEDRYFKEIQSDVWQHSRKRSMVAILSIGGILFASDLLALSIANELNGVNFLYVLIIPAIYLGLGLFAKLQPMVSVIAATILFAAIIIINIYGLGARSIFSGLLVKAVVIFFIFSAFNHARQAEKARRNLQSVI